MSEFPVPPDDAGEALSKKTHWRVYKTPPSAETIAAEPVASVLTALTETRERILLVKVGADRWLHLEAGYTEAVDAWREAATAASPRTVAGAALDAILQSASGKWCINRMFTNAGTLPPPRTSAKSAARKTGGTRAAPTKGAGRRGAAGKATPTRKKKPAAKKTRRA
jgi:hypothetical protein